MYDTVISLISIVYLYQLVSSKARYSLLLVILLLVIIIIVHPPAFAPPLPLLSLALTLTLTPTSSLLENKVLLIIHTIHIIA